MCSFKRLKCLVVMLLIVEIQPRHVLKCVAFLQQIKKDAANGSIKMEGQTGHRQGMQLFVKYVSIKECTH